jgi:hypothetical protein
MVLINLSSCSTFYTTQDTPRRVDAIPLFGEKIDKSSTPGAFCVMDTTIWRPVRNFELLYEVSNTGLARSLRKCETAEENLIICSRILRPRFDKDCYLGITLTDYKKELISAKIHRLVAQTFIPNPENKPFVDHVNGVRWDNRVENLRWVTQSENQQSSYNFGRKVKKGKSVDKFDLNGNFIKRYRVITDVELEGLSSRNVNKAVLGQRKTAFGFIWKEVVETEMTEI